MGTVGFLRMQSVSGEDIMNDFAIDFGEPELFMRYSEESKCLRIILTSGGSVFW